MTKNAEIHTYKKPMKIFDTNVIKAIAFDIQIISNVTDKSHITKVTEYTYVTKRNNLMVLVFRKEILIQS